MLHFQLVLWFLVAGWTKAEVWVDRPDGQISVFHWLDWDERSFCARLILAHVSPTFVVWNWDSSWTCLMRLVYQQLPDAEQVYQSHEGVEETDRNEYCFMLHNNSTSNIARNLFTSILFLLQLQPTFEVPLKSPSKSDSSSIWML